MATKWFLCQKCETLVKQESTPNSNHCPSDGRTHQWRMLGELGETNYQCKKCGIIVQCRSIPNPNHCPSDGKTHQWHKL